MSIVNWVSKLVKPTTSEHKVNGALSKLEKRVSVHTFEVGVGKKVRFSTENASDLVDFQHIQPTMIIKGQEWRLLSREEWFYLISQRPQASQKVAMACIDDTNGLVILPDNFVMPTGGSFKPGISEGPLANKYTKDEWKKYIASGAVFLPMAGVSLQGTQGERVDYVNQRGSYWINEKMQLQETDGRIKNTGWTMSFYYEQSSGWSNLLLLASELKEKKSVRYVLDIV